MNGVSDFVVNWRCGCVFSEKAMLEIKGSQCHGCNGPLDAADIIKLNAEGELLKEYETRIMATKKAKREKKADNAVKSNGDRAAVKRKAVNSIQDDPNVSKAVKSMFTTSEAAKNQPRAHWVTHNPLYY